MEQMIKEIDVEEISQLLKNHNFAEDMEHAVKNEKNQLKSKMKEWTDSHVIKSIDKMKKFKASVESIPMVSFVNQRN